MSDTRGHESLHKSLQLKRDCWSLILNKDALCLPRTGAFGRVIIAGQPPKWPELQCSNASILSQNFPSDFSLRSDIDMQTQDEAMLLEAYVAEVIEWPEPYHSELKYKIWLANYSWGCNTQIWQFCLLLDFLDAKDFETIIKGWQGSKRPNQRKIKILMIFSCQESFGVNFIYIFLFSSFKVIEIKKATVIAGAAFLHIKVFIFLKVLL